MKGDFDVIKELTEKDFARGVRNPYFDKLMTKTEIAVRKKDYKLFEELGKPYGISAEVVMRNYLGDLADEFRESDDEQ